MTFDEYRNSQAWKKAKEASARRRKRRNVIGVILIVVDLLLLLAGVAEEFVPDTWYQKLPALREIILAFGIIALAFTAGLWLFSKKFEESVYITREFFEAQKLLAKECDFRMACLGGVFDLTAQFDFTDGIFGGSGEKLSALRLTGINGEHTIPVSAWSDEGTFAFLMGVLQIGTVSYLTQCSERGERIDAALLRFCVDGEKITTGKFKKRDAVYFVKNGKFTGYANSIYRKIKRLEKSR